MPRMQATVTQKFAGRRVEAGEFIEATEREAKMLLALQRARVVPLAPPPVAVQQRSVASSENAPKPKRAYRRRDMRAEG